MVGQLCTAPVVFLVGDFPSLAFLTRRFPAFPPDWWLRKLAFHRDIDPEGNNARSIAQGEGEAALRIHSSEQDPDRFMELVNALNNLLQQGEKRATPSQLLPEPATEM
jgi:hypothetical protein